MQLEEVRELDIEMKDAIDEFKQSKKKAVAKEWS